MRSSTPAQGYAAGSVSRRMLAAVLTVLLVSSGLVVGTATPASAGLYNIFPADVDGFPKGKFFADEALFATFVSDLEGGRLCVVHVGVVDPSTTNCDDQAAWGAEPRFFVGIGTFLGMPLVGHGGGGREPSPLPTGHWRLMADATFPKEDDASENEWRGTELSEVFEVVPCRGECDFAPAQAQLQDWKDIAERQLVPFKGICVINDLLGVLDAINEGNDALDAIKVARGIYAMGGGGLASMMVGAAVGAAGLIFDTPESTEDRAKALLKDLSCRMSSMYEGIYNDPPDFDHATVAAPELRDLPRSGDPLLDELAETWERMAAYGDASRIAYERFQGAVIDGDDEAAALQAQASADFTFELVAGMRRSQRLQSEVADLDWFDEPIATQELLDESAAHRRRVHTDGHTESERQQLLALGFDESVLDQLEAEYGENAEVFEAIDPDATLADALEPITALLPEAIEVYDDFARRLDVTASEYDKLLPVPQPNRAPVSGFTATPTSGVAPLTVEFASTAYDADGDDLTLRWDIAGIRYVDDETSVTHTFETPGTYGVSLVADDGEAWDQAIMWVTLMPPDAGPDPANRPPVAQFTPRLVDEQGPVTQTFTSTSFDPDGDELTHTWYFGDGEVLTGPSVTRTFDAGFIYSVLLVVADEGGLTGQAAGEVTSRHPVEDPDPNQPPVADFAATPTTGTAPLEVQFTSTSTDPDGDPLTHTWHFGDGQSGEGEAVSHVYAGPGTYTVTLVVDDGRVSRVASRQVVVTPEPAVLDAAFTTSTGYDAAKLVNGARIVSASSELNDTSSAASNVVAPTNQSWNTPLGNDTDERIVLLLPADGRDLLDRIVLTGANVAQSPRTVSVEVASSTSPAGPYVTVVDRAEMERSSAAQEFTFEPRTARFVRVILHDNHGATSFRLNEIALPTVDREGGIVSLPHGPTARIVDVSGAGSTTPAENVLLPNASSWATPMRDVDDHFLRVALGGDGPHLLDTVQLRGSTSDQSVKGFEVLTSEDGTGWTSVVSDELPQDSDLHTFTFPPRSARYVELRVVDNHGSTSTLRLNELRAMTTHGLNAADGERGVGAAITSASPFSSTNRPENAIDASATSRWQSVSGQTTDQHLRVLLRNGEVHTIDRVMVAATGNRPRAVEVWVSDTGQDPGDFTRVAERILLDTSGAQWLSFDPVDARYVELRILDGYSATAVTVAELQVHSPQRGAGTDVPFVDTSVAGEHDLVAWSWDFGHAGGASTEQHPVHTFPGPGTYEVTLTVTDAAGTARTATSSFTVPADPAISLEATPATTVDEGQLVNLRAVGSDIVSWSWDLGYTQPNTTSATTIARFPDQGDYTVAVRGFTGNGLWTEPATLDFTVRNVAPTVRAGNAVTAFAGEELTPANNVSVSDPGADTLTCTWDWGDGTSTVVEECTSVRAGRELSHVYALPGAYTATLTVDDGDGGVTSDTVTYTAMQRPSFVQFREVVAGDDLTATVRLVDGRDGRPLGGEDLTLAADGSTPSSGSTDANGERTVTLTGASEVESLTATFTGSVLYLPSALTRPVSVPAADIVVVADRSESMTPRHEAVIDRISDITRGLASHLDYRLGLVGYAHGGIRPDGVQYAPHLMAPLTDEMATFLPTLHELRDTESATANGYAGVVRATDDDLGFRANAATCFVLVTDAEASEIAGSGLPETKEDAVAAVATRGGTVFSIYRDNVPAAEAYGEGVGLAGLTGGRAWPITEFVDDASAVLEALVDGCVEAAVTPDIAVAKTSTSDVVAPGETVTYTLTVSNEAAVDVTGVELVDDLPEGVTFVGASDGGAFDEQTGEVRWPAVAVPVGASIDRTITVRMPSDDGPPPGDHELTNRAVVSDDGSQGPERREDNNTDEHTVTLRVPDDDAPRVDDVGVEVSHDQPGGVEAGQRVDHTITVTNHGTHAAEDVRVLQRIEDRFEVEAIDAPGWTNPSGSALVGAHPDGVTTGTWLHLEREQLGVETSVEVTVTSRMLPLDQPPVLGDEGSLDELPPVVAAPPSSSSTAVCVEADRDDVGDNDCADLRVPLRDLVAQLTVRASGGAPFLIVSVAATDPVGDGPVTLRWTPLRDGGPVDAVPAEVVIDDLVPGTTRVVPWPGVLVEDGEVVGWPGWRPLTGEDRDDDGGLLHPVTGEPMTEAELEELVRGELLLDPNEPGHAWRADSRVHLSANPEATFTVTYREDGPGVPAPEPEGPDDPADPEDPADPDEPSEPEEPEVPEVPEVPEEPEEPEAPTDPVDPGPGAPGDPTDAEDPAESDPGVPVGPDGPRPPAVPAVPRAEPVPGTAPETRPNVERAATVAGTLPATGVDRTPWFLFVLLAYAIGAVILRGTRTPHAPVERRR